MSFVVVMFSFYFPEYCPYRGLLLLAISLVIAGVVVVSGLVKRVRALSPEKGGDKPIVALSAYAAKSDRVRALSAGFTHYLHKPVDFEELVSTIQAVTKK